jgi:hypothetical protein
MQGMPRGDAQGGRQRPQSQTPEGQVNFTVALSDEDVAALREGLANGGILPGRGVDVGRSIRARLYAQVVAQLRGDEVTHRHTEAQLLAGTPTPLRAAFAELRGELAANDDHHNHGARS